MAGPTNGGLGPTSGQTGSCRNAGPPVGLSKPSADRSHELLAHEVSAAENRDVLARCPHRQRRLSPGASLLGLSDNDVGAEESGESGSIFLSNTGMEATVLPRSRLAARAGSRSA